MKIIPSSGFAANSAEGEKRVINSELWHACAGPLIALPPLGSLVVYFPQGHSEQVAASMQKETDAIPSYPNLPSKLICMLHNVTLHADTETDEVYAQLTLQPVNKYDQDALLVSDNGLKQSRQPAEFFCKTLTASDTSTHGGFSVPRRAAEKIFPPLDFTMQPPAQELSARDLHDQAWTFKHIFRGQPKRHLLTTGWSVFVSTKRLVAGDAVLFIRDEKLQFLLGIRRATRQQPALSSSVISSDSMHIGILAAAAHAAANNSPFTVFFNPRASPSEFVVPLSKYNQAMYSQVSPGMRFRMMFETEESGVRRYMGTVTGITDLDPVRWKNSQWRNLQVGWDESTAGDRPSRVSIWDIEPVVTPFYICPPPFFRPKFTKLPCSADDESDVQSIFRRGGMPWLADDFGLKDASNSIFPALSLVQWISMQQNLPGSANQPILFSNSTPVPGNISIDEKSKILNFQTPALAAPNLHLSKVNHPNQLASQLQQSTASWPSQPQLPHMLPSPILSQQPVQHQQFQLQQPQPQLLQQTLQQLQEQMQRPQQPPLQNQLQQSALSPALPCDQTRNQNSQQTSLCSQIQQNKVLSGNVQVLQTDPASNKTAFPVTPLTHDPLQVLQFQQDPLQVLQQNIHLRRGPQNLSDQQMQLLQKMQHHPQLLSPPNQSADSQFLHIQQIHQKQGQPAQVTGTCFSTSASEQSPQIPVNHFQNHQMSPFNVRPPSVGVSEDTPSCSMPSQNNFQVSKSSFLNRNQVGFTSMQDNTLLEHQSSNLLLDTRGNKIDIQVKHEMLNPKVPDHPKYTSTVVDSYCLAAGAPQQSFLFTGFDTDCQSRTQGGHSFSPGMDGLAPDALLSKGFDMEKDIRNLLSNCSGIPGDIDPDLSNGINSLPFGERTMSFKSELAINDPNALNSGLRPNQPLRMRTYAKVQKRGSVGRTIDVTRYMGYDELKRDLGCMFGIDGQLEDPQQTEWKLVYVDHENDILLVGDDPWEEFVSCVQSIKILSYAEVQQMSLDGDLSSLPMPNQTCCRTDSGNDWRGLHDNTSASSFNR